ncbi:MAG: 3-deoxy-D-manno-octulosonic acid transferase [Prevotellaceae bacterium]|nr:3-deoxy-D-manno-octulosonic acid transferase [Prevotellaceae bacterium]
MLRILYNIGIYLFILAVKVASLFHHKARLFVAGRRGWAASLEAFGQAGTPTAWFHCASLGEFEQGRPVIEAYRAKYPQHKILLTFFSPSGYEVRKNYDGVDSVCYLPHDTPRTARRFIRLVKPVVAVFIKYEFWYNFLLRLEKEQVPTYLVSAIFRPKQVFFRWYGVLFRRMLRVFRVLFVQDGNSVALLKNIGVANVVRAGDTRFDRVWMHTHCAADLPQIAAFTAGRPTLVAGSTWTPDDEKLAEAWAMLTDERRRLVIAPHEVTADRLSFIESQFAAFRTVRYTQLSADDDLQTVQVLIIDTVGILLPAYRYGQVAFVGGGFSATGIHNILEPAAYGLPVVFGHNYEKYAEAHELIVAGGARSVNNASALYESLHEWLSDVTAQQSAGAKSAAYVQSRTGATTAIIQQMTTGIFA